MDPLVALMAIVEKTGFVTFETAITVGTNPTSHMQNVSQAHPDSIVIMANRKVVYIAAPKKGGASKNLKALLELLESETAVKVSSNLTTQGNTLVFTARMNGR